MALHKDLSHLKAGLSVRFVTLAFGAALFLACCSVLFVPAFAAPNAAPVNEEEETDPLPLRRVLIPAERVPAVLEKIVRQNEGLRIAAPTALYVAAPRSILSGAVTDAAMHRTAVITLPEAQTGSCAYGINARVEPITADALLPQHRPAWRTGKCDRTRAVIIRTAACLGRSGA